MTRGSHELEVQRRSFVLPDDGSAQVWSHKVVADPAPDSVEELPFAAGSRRCSFDRLADQVGPGLEVAALAVTGVGLAKMFGLSGSPLAAAVIVAAALSVAFDGPRSHESVWTAFRWLLDREDRSGASFVYGPRM